MQRNYVIPFLIIGLITCSLEGNTTLPQVKDTLFHSDVKSGLTVERVRKTFVQADSGNLKGIPDNDRGKTIELLPNHFILGFSTGPGYLAGSIKDAKASFVSKGLSEKQVDDFFGQLRYGWTGDVNIHYLVFRHYGVGLNAFFFNTGAREWITFDPTGRGTILEGEWNKKTRVTYFGPGLIAEQSWGNPVQWEISVSLSAGIAGCHDENAFLESHVDLSGKALAATGSLGIQYFLNRHVSLGVKADLFATHLRKVTVSYDAYSTTVDLKKEKLAGISIENLSVADISAGMKIYF